MEIIKQKNFSSVSVTEDDLIRHLYYLPQGIKRLEQLGETIKVDKNHVLNISRWRRCGLPLTPGRM